MVSDEPVAYDDRSLFPASTPLSTVISDLPPSSQVLEHFGVDLTKGLTDFQVAEHRRIYGRNGIFPLSMHVEYAVFPLELLGDNHVRRLQ